MYMVVHSKLYLSRLYVSDHRIDFSLCPPLKKRYFSPTYYKNRMNCQVPNDVVNLQEKGHAMGIYMESWRCFSIADPMKITLFFHNYRNTLHGRGTNLDSIGLLFTSLYPGFLNKCIEIVGAAVTPSTTMVGKLVSITWLTIRSTVNVLIYLDVGDG